MTTKRLTWKQAEEELCVCRLTIQRYAKAALKKMHPRVHRRKLQAILETEGVSFDFYGTRLWMARRGHRYVLKLL